jgi:hypothetical protein
MTSLVFGCELAPSRPEDVFTVFRERMKSGDLGEARKLLSDESRSLVESLNKKYKLEMPPEDLAILNLLDPQSNPTVTMVEEKFALLRVRTLRGAPRMVRLVRNDSKANWKINLNEELESLASFLEAQTALEMLRDRAGDYAATWRAFSDQLDRINIFEEPKGRFPAPGKPTQKDGPRTGVR